MATAMLRSAGVLSSLIASGGPVRADDTNLFGASPGTFIPFVKAIDSPDSGLPKVRLDFGDGVAHAATMDTGSVGLVVSRDTYNPAGPGLRTGSIVYNSSGIVENGNYYQTTFSFLGADGKAVATTSLPVLVVDSISCLANARQCTPSSSVSGVLQLGVGFGQEAASQPHGVPSNNPFLNITQTASNVLPSKGYMIDRTGVTLGLQQAALDGFSLVKLAPYPEKSTAAFPEWLLAPATVSVNGTAASGVILSDTGVTGMYLTAPTGSNISTFKSLSLECGDSCAAQGTTVTVSIPGQAGGTAGYSFTVGPDGGKQAGNAMSPVFVSVDGSAPSPYVNTTLNLFNNFDYLYDETDGFVGFRQRDASMFGATSPGMTLQGSVSLPANFVSNLPTYLMGYQQLMAATTDSRTFLQQYGVPVQLQANGSATFNNVVSGPGSLEVASGLVTLTATNTYTGSTLVDAGGTLALSRAGSIGVSSGVTVNGAFDISGTANGTTLASLSGGGQVRLGGQALSVANGGGFSGVIGDGGLAGGQGGSLSVTGGTLMLSGANTYTGLTTVAANAVLGLNGAGSVSRSSGVAANGTFDISGTMAGATVASLSGAGQVRLGGQLLSVANGGAFAGVIGEGGVAGGQNGSLAVTGGTLTLSGANTYQGSTTVMPGATLALSGAGAVSSSSGVVANGAFDISGTRNGAVVASLSGAGQVQLGGQSLSVARGGRFAGTLADGGLSGGQNGSLAVTGGTLLLSGINTYGGATTIAPGATLALTGAGSVSRSSGVVADGVFDVSGVAGARIVDLSGGGTVRLGGQTLTLTGGAGQFTGTLADGGQAGGTGGGIAVSAGTQVLSGVHTHTGATTVAAGATVAFSGNASAAQSRMALASGGTLDVSSSSGAVVGGLSGAGAVRLGGQTLTLAGAGSTFAGSITDGGLAGGTGGTLIVAAGTHTLTGVNSHTGGTVVRTGGTLAIATDAALGASGSGLLLDGGTLQALGGLATGRSVTTTANGATLDGTMAAMALNGSLDGAGALSTAGSIGFNGAGAVAGTLSLGGFTSVNGTLAAGNLVVQPGATLRGTGQINAPLTVLGTLAPGNSPGTLLVVGPVTLSPSSVSQFDIDGTGTGNGSENYSRLLVTTGSLALDGTALPQLRGLSGDATNSFTPALGQQFTVASAAGGLSSSFARLVQPAGLAQGTRLDALYGPTTVSFVATPSSYGNLLATGLAQSASQASLGAAIDAVRPVAGSRPAGPLATLLGALYPLPGAAIAPVLDGLGAKIYGDALFAGLEQQRLVADAVSDQLATLRGAAPSVRAQVTPASWGGTVWARGLGAWTDRDRDNRGGGSGATLSGVAAGADVRLRDDVLAGLAIAYTGAATSAENGGSDSAQALHMAGYAGWQAGSLFVNALGGGTWTEDRFRRALPLLNTTAQGRSGSEGVFGRAEAGLGLSFDTVRVTPSMAFGGQALGRDRTAENAENSAALSVSSGSLRSLRSEMGARVEAPLTVAGRMVTPTLRLGWSHEFGDTSAAATASFLNFGGPAFTSSTAAFGRDGLTGGAGVTATVAPRVTLFAAYDADIRTRYTVQAVTGGLQVSW